MNAEDERGRLLRENEALRLRVEQLERAAAAAADADATSFLQSVLAALPAFIARTDGDLRMRYINQYQPGLTPDDVLGRSILDFILPEYREAAAAVLTRTRDTGELGFYETTGMGAHGEAANYETYVAAVPEPDGRTGLCVASLEVTAHKRRELALRESQELLRVALEATGLGLWSWNVARGQVVWDEAMRRLHGGGEPPPDLTTYVERFVHPHDRDEARARSRRVAETGHWPPTTFRIVRPDGQVRWLMSTGRVLEGPSGEALKVVGGTLDVTEQRALEDQLRQSQKMEAIGSLTAGIAHNFNNMLMVIMPTLELATRLVPDERRPILREATHAAQRASELVRQLMTFAGQRWSDELAPHRVTAIVDAAVGICRRAFDQRVSLHTVYEEPDATVSCSAGQIEQVLVNLLLNARDAVLERAGNRGHVTVRVSAAASPLPPIAPDGAPRPAVRIAVSDDGVGMDEEVKAKAFEPFFTTKPVGRGTGLGLATSYAIVRDHHGALRCESEPGTGSTFEVLLPTAEGTPRQTSGIAESRVPDDLSVLLVDDDAAVRSAVKHVLLEAGLRVREAHSGMQAIAMLSEHDDAHVVLLDRSMPDAPGERFVPQIRELAPSARILFFSGQTIDPALAALADGVVHKPVHAAELLSTIRRVVAAGDAGAGRKDD